MPDTITYLAELYKTDSKGKTRHWRIWTEGNVIKTEHGELGGALVLSEKTVKGKNIGKANETTPEEQAISEALSTAQKKRDKNYGDTPGHTEIKILPMLAHDFRKREKYISYPCYVQPKLDGVRCFAQLDENGYVKLTSRSGKEFPQPLEALKNQMRLVMEFGEIWDGELYTPELTFQELCAAVKKGAYRESSEKVEFHLFDVFRPGGEFADLTFRERFDSWLTRLFMAVSPNGLIKPVETLTVNSKEEAMEYYSRCMENGYEGIMFRNPYGIYTPGNRSKDLQKYKEFIDEEFVITGAQEGSGKDAGTIIFECRTGDRENTIFFDVRPRGTHEQRSQWWQDRDQLIGKKLTVRYQNLTDDGVPRFPVGIGIRDYE